MKTSIKTKGLSNQDKKQVKCMRELRKGGRGRLWTTHKEV